MAADVQIRFKAESSEARAEIDLLRKEIGYLREGFKRTQEAADVGNNALARFRGETIALTHVFVRSIDDFGGALNQFDRRFLGFHERVDAFTGAIHRLPPEITAVRDAFDVLAPTAGRVASIFADIETSLVDTGAETESFRRVFEQLGADIEQLEADFERAEFFASFGEIAAHQANLIRPGVSDAVRSFRDYNDVLSETDVEYRSVADILQEVTGAIRNQASALSEVSRAAETAGIDISDALDRLDAEIEPVGREISNLELALQSLGDNSGDVLDSLIGQFSQLDGVAGNLGSKLGQFDIAGLASGNPNAIATLPFQLYDAFTFDQRQADALRPELNRQNQASFERGEFGIPSDLLGFGRGQLDRAATATGTSGFGGRPLLELLEGLEPQIGRTSLDDVANIPDRIIETIQGFTDQVIEGLTDELAQATFDLDFARQTGGDVEGALQDVIDANTTLYQTQIDAYNLQRQATGRAIGNVDELNRILNTLNNQARLQLDSGPQNAQQFIAANNITRGLTAPTDDQERGVVADVFSEGPPEEATPETVDTIADDALANALRITQEAINIINTGITRLDNVISQSNDPAEIADLLDQIADQIPESYRLRREALQQQFDAGEITLSALNNGIANLNIEESAAIEQNSDRQLANALQVNQAQINAISVGISDLENQISQSNDPAEIATLLMQIAVQIPESYRLRRNALSKQYAAGEITRDAINTGIAALNIEESAALEQNGDQILANTLRINQEAQTAINTGISGLEQTLTTSNDPAEIATLLQEIAVQIPEIYRLRREALQAQYDAGEITLEALHTGIASLNIAEAAAIEQNSDRQIANLFADHNADIQLIANTVDIVSDAIRNSTDPEEIAQLLVDLRAAIMEKYRLQREFLQAQLDAEEITIKQYQARSGRLGIQESRQLGGADSLAQAETQEIADTAQREAAAAQRTANQAAAAAQRAANKAAQAAQTAANKAAQAAQRAANKAAQAAQRAADEVSLANALRANQDQIGAINVEVSRLENVISTSNDPAEIVQLLMQIAVQIPETYRLRREALQTQFDAGKLTREGLENGIASLGIEQSAALEQNSDAQLTNALRINQQATDAVATEIAALENTIGQSNDPAEIESLLQRIATQIPEIYRLRRDALQAQYDAGEITLLALNTSISQLNIDESGALEQNSDAQLANSLSQHNTDIENINTATGVLQDQIRNSDDPANIAQLTIDLRTAIEQKYALQRQILQAQLDAQEVTIAQFETQLGGLNVQEGQALAGADTLAGTERDNLARTTNNLLQNAIQRAEFRLSGATSEQGFETRHQELITAINEFYDAEEQRISQLSLSEAELQNLREDNTLARQLAIGRVMTTENRFTTERIRAEETAQAEIERLRDEAIEREERRQQEIQDLKNEALEAEKDRQEALVALEEETQEKITDIQRKAEQKREDIEREFNRDFEDNFRSTQEKISELLSEEGFGGGEIRDFLSGFEGDIRSRLSDSGRSQLREIEDQRLETEIDSRRERDRDLEDVGIQEGRQIEDTRLQQERERIAMDVQLLQQQSQLNTSMNALTSELSGISATETVVAAASKATTAAETAASHAVVATENVGMGIEAANTAASTLDGIVQQELQIVETISGVSDKFVRAAEYLSQTEALPRLADAVRDLPEKFGEVLSERLVVPLISALGNLKGPVGAPERIGIIPMGVPVGGPEGDNRLFHFDQTDAIAHRLARSAALNRPRAAPAYLPDSNQIRNARDVSKEIVAGLTEGLSQRNSGFGNVGASQQSGLPEGEITANITIEFPDGSVQELHNQILRLSAQDRI